MLSTIFFAHSKTPISGVQLMGVSSFQGGFLLEFKMSTTSSSSSIRPYYEDNHANVRAALTYLSSEDRSTWIKAGAALKSEFGENGFAIWDEWSQSAPNYNARDAKSTWKSFKEGRINIGTLFFEAKRNGFVPAQRPQPLSKEEWQKKREEMQARRLAAERELAAKQEAAKKVANERWEKANGAQINHPYLVKKGINTLAIAKHLRQEGDNLLVPARQFGQIHGVQTISPDGEKRFNKDAALSGSSMMFGSWGNAKQNKEIVLVEGLATGASIHLATGKTVVVCFSANNLEKIAEKLAKQTDLQVVIGADLDRSGTGQGTLIKLKHSFQIMPWCYCPTLPSKNLASLIPHQTLMI